MAVYTAIYTAELYDAGWQDVTAYILDVQGGNEATPNSDNALAFGDSSQSRLTARARLPMQSYAWKLSPFRITYGMDALTAKAFHGVITSRDRSLDDLTLECEGYAALIRDVKEFSPAFHRRPVATKTTASSVEDPDDTSYRGGALNWLLWTAGGRPLEQDFDADYVTDAKFWYSLDQALLAPEWSWIAGENAWEEALKLVQASGGQLYQAPDGTIVYRQPYMIGDGAASGRAYNTSNFKTIRERQASRQTMTKALVFFIPRFLRPTQDVVTDDTERLIQVGETITFDLEPQWPIYTLEVQSAGQLKPEALIVNLLSGFSPAVMDTDFSHTVSYSAAKVSISITNLASSGLVVSKVTLRGQPIIAGEAGNVTVGADGTTKTVADQNTYIQSLDHAERLANIYLDFYADAHPLRTISGVVLDPELEIGDVVTLTVAEWSLDTVEHVVVTIRHSQTGAEMELDLVEIDGLPKTSDHFIVGEDATGLTKLLGY